MTLAAIYSFVADRFQAADFEGSLTLNMLKVGNHAFSLSRLVLLTHA